MCLQCLYEARPHMGTLARDDGAMLGNLRGCAACGVGRMVKPANRCVVEEDEGASVSITFDHVCEGCAHIVASHSYSFSVENRQQLYEMDCDLCGEALSEVLVYTAKVVELDASKQADAEHKHAAAADNDDEEEEEDGDVEVTAARYHKSPKSLHPPAPYTLSEEAAAAAATAAAAYRRAKHARTGGSDDDSDSVSKDEEPRSHAIVQEAYDDDDEVDGDAMASDEVEGGMYDADGDLALGHK